MGEHGRRMEEQERRFERRMEEQGRRVEEHVRRMERKLERRDKWEKSKYSAMNKISHQHQVEFNHEMVDILIEIEEELEEVFEGMVPEALGKLLV